MEQRRGVPVCRYISSLFERTCTSYVQNTTQQRNNLLQKTPAASTTHSFKNSSSGRAVLAFANVNKEQESGLGTRLWKCDRENLLLSQ